ncbi:unnamed protein product, partial [Rotaria magnacalcarata]
VRRRALSYHHRYLADHISSKSSSTTDTNEWLWEYLRHRQSYQLLTDEQKRQVILL